MPVILSDKKAPAFYIRFNRPERLNAVNKEVYELLEKAISAAESDNEVRVIVLGGEGRAFCVGADLKDHASAHRSESEKKAYARQEQNICLQIQNSPKPFVAAVHGYALGAGAEIALACDFVLMTNTAKIGFPETGLGTFIGGGLTANLPLLVGLRKARELVMLGERIDGSQAYEAGLVYQTADEAGLDKSVNELVEKLSLKAPLSLSMVKRQLRDNLLLSGNEIAELETKSLLDCMKTEDWAEGAKAFTEKRPPVFKGR